MAWFGLNYNPALGDSNLEWIVAASPNTGPNVYAYGDSAISLNKWYIVECEWKRGANGYHKLYVDGELIGVASVSNTGILAEMIELGAATSKADGPTTVYVDYFCYDDEGNFDGLVDDVDIRRRELSINVR
jgi:hypothetical protein